VENSHAKPAVELRDRIVKNAVFQQRLWILGAGRSSIRLLPPLIINDELALELVARLELAITQEISAVRQMHSIGSAAT